MGPAIAGLLILGVFFTGAFMLFRTTLFGDVVVSNAVQEATDLAAERARTSIRITPDTGETANNTGTLTISVENTGSTTIHPLRLSVLDFSIMDVIVQYPAGIIPATRLSYTASAPPAAGEWSQSLTPESDLFERGIFNPGEIMVIVAQLPQRGDDTGWVTVATPNGVVDSSCFRLAVACP